MIEQYVLSMLKNVPARSYEMFFFYEMVLKLMSYLLGSPAYTRLVRFTR